MPDPNFKMDTGGNPLKEGILADGGWNNRMKRDESFASVAAVGVAPWDEDEPEPTQFQEGDRVQIVAETVNWPKSETRQINLSDYDVEDHASLFGTVIDVEAWSEKHVNPDYGWDRYYSPNYWEGDSGETVTVQLDDGSRDNFPADHLKKISKNEPWEVEFQDPVTGKPKRLPWEEWNNNLLPGERERRPAELEEADDQWTDEEWDREVEKMDVPPDQALPPKPHLREWPPPRHLIYRKDRPTARPRPRTRPSGHGSGWPPHGQVVADTKLEWDPNERSLDMTPQLPWYLSADFETEPDFPAENMDVIPPAGTTIEATLDRNPGGLHLGLLTPLSDIEGLLIDGKPLNPETMREFLQSQWGPAASHPRPSVAVTHPDPEIAQFAADSIEAGFTYQPKAQRIQKVHLPWQDSGDAPVQGQIQLPVGEKLPKEIFKALGALEAYVEWPPGSGEKRRFREWYKKLVPAIEEAAANNPVVLTFYAASPEMVEAIERAATGDISLAKERLGDVPQIPSWLNNMRGASTHQAGWPLALAVGMAAKPLVSKMAQHFLKGAAGKGVGAGGKGLVGKALKLLGLNQVINMGTNALGLGGGQAQPGMPMMPVRPLQQMSKTHFAEGWHPSSDDFTDVDAKAEGTLKDAEDTSNWQELFDVNGEGGTNDPFPEFSDHAIEEFINNLPMVIKHFLSEESGLNDGAFQALHELFDSEAPGYLHLEVGLPHADGNEAAPYERDEVPNESEHTSARYADSQGPHTPEQIKAVAELLLQNRREDEIPRMIEAPWEYVEELSAIQNRITKPPPAVEQTNEAGPQPPVMETPPEAGMPMPGMSADAMMMQAAHRVAEEKLHGEMPNVPKEDPTTIKEPRDIEKEDPSLTWTDSQGNPLRTGELYELHSPEFNIPDIVKIEAVKPDVVEYTLEGEWGLNHRVEVTLEEAQIGKYFFEPINEEEESEPNEDEAAEEEARAVFDRDADSGETSDLARPHSYSAGTIHSTYPEHIQQNALGTPSDQQYDSSDEYWKQQADRSWFRQIHDEAMRDFQGRGLETDEYRPWSETLGVVGRGIIDDQGRVHHWIEDDGTHEQWQNDHPDIQANKMFTISPSGFIRPWKGQMLDDADKEHIKKTIPAAEFDEAADDIFVLSRIATGMCPQCGQPLAPDGTCPTCQAKQVSPSGAPMVSMTPAGYPPSGSGPSHPPSQAKLAGKKYTPMEQREFIDEQGIARNADKLDLRGTHYESHVEIDDDDFGWW